MLHIIKNYKTLLTFLLLSGFESNQVKGFDSNSDKRLDHSELDKLIDKLKDENDQIAQEIEARKKDLFIKGGNIEDVELLVDVINNRQRKEKETINNEKNKKREVIISDTKESKERVLYSGFIARLENISFQKRKEVIDVLGKELPQNSSRELNKKVQTLLVDLGYDISYFSKNENRLLTGYEAVDGDLLDKFKDAIRLIQTELGINNPTGSLDIDTASKITEVTSGFIKDKTLGGKVDKDENGAISRKYERSGVKTKEKQGSLNVVMGSDIKNEQLWGEVNKSSITDIIVSMSGGDLLHFAQEIWETREKHNKRLDDEGNFIDYYYGMFNPELEKLFRSKGYDSNGGLGGVEMGSLVNIVLNQVQTQKSISNMQARERINILMDIDKNGILTADISSNFGSELSLDRSIFDNMTSDGADVFLENLGLGGLNEFTKKMSENLLSAKTDFQRVLGVMLEKGFKINELTKKGGPQNAVERIFKDRKKIQEIITKTVDEKMNDEEFQSRNNLTNLSSNEKAQASRTLKLEAINLLSSPDVSGLGINYNIENLGLFFDSVSFVGFDGQGLGMVVNKEILSKNGFKLGASAGIGNSVYLLNASYTTEGDRVKIKNLLDKQIDGDYTVTSYLSGGTTGDMGLGAIGVNFNIVDENTSAGIEKSASEIGKIFRLFKESIYNGEESFDVNELSVIKGLNNDKGKESISRIYTEMKISYDKYAKNTQFEREFLDDMVASYVSEYKNALYNDAKGYNFASIGFGVAALAGFNPVPYMTLGFEHISQKWEKVIHSNQREREISETNISMHDIYSYRLEHNGNSVLVIEGGAKYNISNSDGATQAEVVGEDLYISGNINSLSYDTHNSSDRYYTTIVINGGNIDSETGLYNYTKTEDISSDIELKENAKKDLNSESSETIDNTKDIRDTLYNMIGYDALKHKDTNGMMKLQKMMFDYKNTGNPSLKDVWAQFNFVINYNGFRRYLKSKKLDIKLDGLISKIDSVNDDNEKVLILQSMSTNFMKRKGLSNIEKGTVKLNGQRTINTYDKGTNRRGFFDRVFKEKFGDGMLPLIAEARESWYKANGDKKSFVIKSIEEGNIAFTGVQSKTASGNNNIDGIFPYTGAYNVASTDGGPAFIDIDSTNKENTKKVIDAVPDRVISNLKLILESRGKKLTDNKAVREFIKNGGDDSLTVDYNLAFCKMGECLNDAVVLRKITIGGTEFTATSTSDVYIAKNDVVNIGFVGTNRRATEEQNDETRGTTSVSAEDAVDVTPGDGTLTNTNFNIGSNVGNGPGAAPVGLPDSVPASTPITPISGTIEALDKQALGTLLTNNLGTKGKR